MRVYKHKWVQVGSGTENYTGECVYRDKCQECGVLSWRWKDGNRQIDLKNSNNCTIVKNKDKLNDLEDEATCKHGFLVGCEKC